MPIPGLRVLDEVIAGLPTNSRLRLDIAELKEQITVLQNENEKLKAEAQSRQPKPELSADAVKILGFFFDQDSHFTADQIASEFQLESSMAKHHLGTLQKKKFVGYYYGGSISMRNAPHRYEIMEDGRAFIVNLRS
jgi:hypothetical protein